MDIDKIENAQMRAYSVIYGLMNDVKVSLSSCLC